MTQRWLVFQRRTKDASTQAHMIQRWLVFSRPNEITSSRPTKTSHTDEAVVKIESIDPAPSIQHKRSKRDPTRVGCKRYPRKDRGDAEGFSTGNCHTSRVLVPREQAQDCQICGDLHHEHCLSTFHHQVKVEERL